MKSLCRSIAVAGGILLLAGVHDASAQIFDTVEFTTAFPFTVGNAVVPAGSYTIRPDDDSPNILHLLGRNASVLFQTESVEMREAPAKSEVVFKRYGDGYVLKDIWVAGIDQRRRNDRGRGRTARSKERSAPGEHRVAARKKVDASKNR